QSMEHRLQKGGLSKTRCEYVPVRSAPPSLAPHGFGKPSLSHPPDHWSDSSVRRVDSDLHCINGESGSSRSTPSTPVSAANTWRYCRNARRVTLSLRYWRIWGFTCS